SSTISGCIGQVYESGGSFSGVPAGGAAGFAVCGWAAGVAANARTMRKAANLIGATYVIHRRMAGRLGFALAVIMTFLGGSTGRSSAQAPAADTAFEAFWSASSP